MKVLKFESIYTDSGWIDNLYISIDDAGKILNTSTSTPEGSYKIENIAGWAIPGIVNTHSHAFQYVMSGTTECIPEQAKGDDFWSWREAMYRTALNISPDKLEKIATALYSEMLSHGYTAVTEFHYLHHDENGRAYANIAEMGSRLIQAAKNVGIVINLVPILYQQCDLESKSTPEQRRFISKTLDEYWKLYDATCKESNIYSRASVSIGIHSIRAVPPQMMAELCHSVDDKIPIHMHIAEQMREVEQCKSVLGKRPIEWLLDNIEVDERYNLVHATHMISDEIKNLAYSKANVVLCPSTEGNLGDGFFPLVEYMKHSGTFSIGTDSHIGMSPFEELRWLDYGQRLKHQKRNVVCLESPCDSGEILLNNIHHGGKLAMGDWDTKMFSKNSPLDCVILDSKHPRFAFSKKENRISTLIYTCDKTVISGVITNGKWVIKKDD